jgi:hypothetical protein
MYVLEGIQIQPGMELLRTNKRAEIFVAFHPYSGMAIYAVDLHIALTS